MKILNWNICTDNEKIRESLDFAMNEDADVICFQELPVKALEDLKKCNHGYHIHYEIDSKVKVEAKNCYIAILSKYPIVNKGGSEYYNKKMNSLYHRINKSRTGQVEVHRSIFIDVETESGKRRINNLHLSWPTGSQRRIDQFLNFMESEDVNDSSIICGDLNIIGVFPWNIILAPFFAIKLSEMRINERHYFDDLFKKYKLQNPFEGTESWNTVPNGCQLDHVLIPNNYKIIEKKLVQEKFGSDHFPMTIEIG